ncbi:MAG: radical SAM protein [Desulfobacteraceae bacterium]|nr:radical SAM protein [Desulfobacteraceae bacterium]
MGTENKIIKDKLIKVILQNSGHEIEVSLEAIVDGIVEFFDIYGEKTLIGKEFYKIIGKGDGVSRLSNLLKISGYKDDPEGFITKVLESLSQSNKKKIVINKITLPHLLLVAILEILIPGHGYVSIKNTEQLVQNTNLDIPDKDCADIQQVMEKFPVRVSKHTIRQMMVSESVAYQYMPFVEELDSIGHTNTWIGQFHEGLLEQMYQNRVIFLLNMTCPVYCRFCFRKHKDSRNEKNPTVNDVKSAVEHVKNSPLIKEIVVTGGDPFLNKNNMAEAIDGLMKIDHVQTLRLATRSVSYYPELFLKNNSSYLKYFKQKNLELQRVGKRMEIATHFIHPDEISPQSLDLISDFVKSGIPVYIQTPFLNDCNDTGPELVRLFSLLRGAGAELHYIYIPCSPIHGNSIYWAPLSKGINIAKYLREHLSDRIIPRICTATPIGKMDWYTSGWAVEKVKDNDDFIWIRTPYTPEYFRNFAPLASELPNIRVNDEGTLDIQYMAKIGEERHLIGSRPKRVSKQNISVKKEDIDLLRSGLANQKQTAQSIVKTGLDNLHRLHETRVEINITAQDKEMNYINSDERITDVVISSEKDAVNSLYYISRIIKKLQNFNHVNSVRLRSMKFNSAPEAFTSSVINTLGDLNKLTVVNPLRVEIETWFISADEITKDHAEIVRKLNNKGITVYCNCPLLGGVNDTDEKIHDLAYSCRQAGIEFHHLYIAGLPLQKKWNLTNPIDSYDVINIATKVRREGSGREIPRYIILTSLGEVDYGLTSSFVYDNDELRIELGCYDMSYFKSMDQSFSLPEDIKIDNNKFIVPVTGFVKSSSFPI